MPVPFIAGAIIVGTAGYGLVKSGQGMSDSWKAEEMNAEIQEYAHEAEEFIKMAQGKAKKAISDLGSEKIQVLTTSVDSFIATFEQIKDMELIAGEGIEELKGFTPSSDKFNELKATSYEAKDVAVNGLAAIGSGVLLAYGTYNVVQGGLGGLLMASTGTPLANLSGAAASNATLAWLGGGSIKAGGLGMAGGTVILGGLVAGAALAVGGSIYAKQGKTALYEARANYDKARVFRQQAKNIGIALKAICTRAEQLTELLKSLDNYFSNEVKNLKSIVETSGTNWGAYSEEQKKSVYKCVQLAQTVKAILDAPLLKEDGTIDEITETVINNGNKYLKVINKM